MILDNLPPRKDGFRLRSTTGLWIISFAMMLALTLLMGCTKHELIDLPTGNVEGSIGFKDIDDFNNKYIYPGGSFQIKAQCDTNTYWEIPDANGHFSFSNLPAGGYRFTLIDDKKVVMSIDHCSFLGGGEPSMLSFWYRIQPDIKSIDYHFELNKDTLWLLGQVELDGIPPVESNTIMFRASFPPDNTQYWNRVVPFDWKSKQIKFMWSSASDLKSGDCINSYVYKKYREFGVVFTNYVIRQDFFGSTYDDLKRSYITKLDSTSIDKFIVP